jgi:multisubunit Na+/H+ antiporter MnhB subunit
MELAFRILAVILAAVAAYFLWHNNGDGAFISAVFGAVSFFLSVRFQVKKRNRQREMEENAGMQVNLRNEHKAEDGELTNEKTG